MRQSNADGTDRNLIGGCDDKGVKLMTLPLECSNEEMQELLELLDTKVGTNNNRKRYEWLRDLVEDATQ